MIDPPFTGLAALMTVRNQSIEELLADVRRYGDLEAMQAEHEPLGWDEAATVLRQLPTEASLMRVDSPVRVRLATKFGGALYAFCCDAVDQALLFIGVHCFEREPLHLTRQLLFVMMSYDGKATVVRADDYGDSLERFLDGDDDDLGVALWPVFRIELETASGGDA